MEPVGFVVLGLGRVPKKQTPRYSWDSTNRTPVFIDQFCFFFPRNILMFTEQVNLIYGHKVLGVNDIKDPNMFMILKVINVIRGQVVTLIT